jgi:Uma2 family endonuclease
MALVQAPLTLDQFLALRERKPALEFEDGVVTQKVAPKTRHSRIQYKFAERVNAFAEPRQLAMAFPELRTTYAGASTVPDVAVYHWARLPVDASGDLVDDCREPPDVVLEIVSPGQSSTALVRRCVWYVSNGVALALLADPADRSVIVFRADGPPLARRGDDPIEFGEIIPGLRFSPRELFSALRTRQ